MPKPLAICLEDLDAHVPGTRYLRCVALPGQEAGLTVDGAGRVLWRSDEVAACEIWVSLDDRLILFRREGGAYVALNLGDRPVRLAGVEGAIVIGSDRERDDEVLGGTLELRGREAVVVATS